MASECTPPKYCFNCGKPFPWTVTRIDVAKKLVDGLEELPSSDREKLSAAISDLSSDTPGTELAALTYKRIFKKLGQDATNALMSIVKEIATEAAKKQIFGN